MHIYKGDLKEESYRKGFSIWHYLSLEIKTTDRLKMIKFRLQQNITL